jgi:hypothetical protein
MRVCNCEHAQELRKRIQELEALPHHDVIVTQRARIEFLEDQARKLEAERSGEKRSTWNYVNQSTV